MTDIAPVIKRRRMSRWPILEVRPKTCFPPLECWRGTSPSQAAKSLPFRNIVSAGAKASMAMAVIGPRPGMVIIRDEASDCAASFFKTASSELTWADKASICAR